MSKDPNHQGHGSGTEIGYRVQVRCDRLSHSSPLAIHDGIISTEWRDVHFEHGLNPAGVPVENGKREHGLMGYEAALALAWTLIAQNPMAFGLECRLVSYCLKTTWSMDREGVVDMPTITQPRHHEIKLVPPVTEPAV